MLHVGSANTSEAIIYYARLLVETQASSSEGLLPIGEQAILGTSPSFTVPIFALQRRARGA